MSASHHLAALALAAAFLAPVAANATDDSATAISSGPTLLALFRIVWIKVANWSLCSQ
jgi:hypothetical protein